MSRRSQTVQTVQLDLTLTHTHNNLNRVFFPKRVLLEVLNSDRAGRLCGSGPQWPRAGAGVAIGVALPAPSGCSGVFILGCLALASRLHCRPRGYSRMACLHGGCSGLALLDSNCGLRHGGDPTGSGCGRSLGATIVFRSCELAQFSTPNNYTIAETKWSREENGHSSCASNLPEPTREPTRRTRGHLHVCGMVGLRLARDHAAPNKAPWADAVKQPS